MILLLRYRTNKPDDGHFSFNLHGGSQILGFTEYYHSEKGWELLVDVVCDTSVPVERRYFLLASDGTNLDVLGEYAFHYHIATYYFKGYASYLFELTHLSETEREMSRTHPDRLRRPRVRLEDWERTTPAGRTARRAVSRKSNGGEEG